MNFSTDILTLFDKKWALVTAGDISDFNAMTISWGGMGTLWGKPVATVYVKPVRYTHEFMENNDYFTISFFEEEYRGALKVMGTKSGRDCNKVEESRLTPVRIGVTSSAMCRRSARSSAARSIRRILTFPPCPRPSARPII